MLRTLRDGSKPVIHFESVESVLVLIFRARARGRCHGQQPGANWTAFNALADHLDYGRWYTTRSNQVQRSFEDTSLKQRALELVMTA